VLLGYVLLTLAVFRPTPYELAHTVPEVDGSIGDGLLYVWAIGHVSKTLFSQPWALFDGRMFHPAADTLAYSDHMIGQALLGLPVWTLTTTSTGLRSTPVGNAVLEFNLLILLSYAAGAAAAFAYVRGLVGGTAAAVAAGIAFAFTPLRFRSPQYIQTLVTFFAPLAMLAWLRFVEQPTWRRWRWWVAAWAAHSLMGMYVTVYFALVMGVVAAWSLVAGPTRREPRLWLGTALAPLATLALLAPTLWPYVRVRATLGLERTGGFDTLFMMLLPARGVSGEDLLGFDHPYQWGPGLVVWALVALGLVVGRRRASVGGLPAPFLWSVNAIGLVTLVSLILLPLEWTQRIPGLDLMRTTHRPFFLALLFIAYFVGEGVAWIQRSLPTPRLREAVGVLLVALVAADMGEPWRERREIAVADDLPLIYRQVRDLPDQVIYDDPGGDEGQPLATYYSLFHGKRLAGGSSGFIGPWGSYSTARAMLFPGDEATRHLWDLGVRHVVKHRPTRLSAEEYARRVESPLLHVDTQLDAALLVRLREPPPPLPSERGTPLPRDRWTLVASENVAGLEALRDESAASSAMARVGEPPTATWIRIDLGDAVPLSAVRLTPALPTDETIYTTRIEVSDDGESWRPVRTWFEPDDRQTLIERPRAIRWFEARFEPTVTRHVRLTNPRAHYRGQLWEIGELEMFARTDSESPSRAPDVDPSRHGDGIEALPPP